MASREFRIVSNGIHPLLLGMTREQLDRVMREEPKISPSRIAGEEVLQFEIANARVVMREGRTVEIAVTPPANVIFEDKSLFQDPSVWHAVVAEDGDAQECLGFIVLQKSGLTLTGFHDNDPAQLAITSFERGRWDAMQGRMKPLGMQTNGG